MNRRTSVCLLSAVLVAGAAHAAGPAAPSAPPPARMQFLPQEGTDVPVARGIDTWIPEVATEATIPQQSDKLANLTEDERATLAALAEGATSETAPQPRVAANRQATIVRAGGEVDSGDGEQQLIPRSFPAGPHFNELRGETTERTIEAGPNTLKLQPLAGDAPLEPLVRFSPTANLPMPPAIATPAAPPVMAQPNGIAPITRLPAVQPVAQPQQSTNPLRGAAETPGANPLR